MRGFCAWVFGDLARGFVRGVVCGFGGRILVATSLVDLEEGQKKGGGGGLRRDLGLRLGGEIGW